MLPGVGYLEMARAAIANALPDQPAASVLELHNTVWAQPIVVQERKEVGIALVATEGDAVDYEIYSDDGAHEVVHCQGRAIFSQAPLPAALALEQLKARMRKGRLESAAVYESCARMGLVYGPAFQGITAIYRGDGEVLADLRLPGTLAETADAFVLHPSLMDGALQAAVGLMDGDADAIQPRLPFALETLRIVAPCTAEMSAWVHYAAGSKAADSVVKLDIDLCDANGTVCVQLRGFSARALSREIDAPATRPEPTGKLFAIPVWEPSAPSPSAVAPAPAEHHVMICAPAGIDSASVESLVPRSRCIALRADERQHVATRYTEHAIACFEQVQSILQSRPHGKVLVQLVVADDPEQRLLAGLSGVLKTAALENPQFTGQLILVPPQITAAELAALLQDETNRTADSLVRYRNGERQAVRWQEVAVEAEPAPLAFKDDGVYLITGGLGGLGVLFAREILARTAAARVVLTGRSALNAETQAIRDGFSPRPERVTYRQVNLDDLEQVVQLVETIERD
ncbi:MAG TPA: polyketide synthase dehydratase domain-containing protein, partial [Thermoanaerobaculia bacterium]